MSEHLWELGWFDGPAWLDDTWHDELWCIVCGYKPFDAEWIFKPDPGCPCREARALTGLQSFLTTN